MAERYPDGIEPEHLRSRRWHRHASPLSLVVLAAVMLTAFSGALGGWPNPKRSVESPAARLTIEAPVIARSGMFVEMRFRVDAAADIENLVLGVSPDYWHELTVNTMMPSAQSEGFGAGGYRFEYGPMRAGDTLIVKVDGQINPALVGGTAGRITLLDGETVLAALPAKMKVRP